jgi:hypothetical protein
MKKDFGSKKKRRAFEYRKREEKRKAQAAAQKRYEDGVRNFDLATVLQAIHDMRRMVA